MLGFGICLANIDEVVQLIKSSSNTEEAVTKLNKRFELSIEQSKAVLDMKLQRLTSLEQEKIHNELGEIRLQIAELRALLSDREL